MARSVAAVVAIAAIGAGVYFGVSRCSSGGSPAAAPSPSLAPSSAPPAVNPLTGKGPDGRVLAVKIDNVGQAQYQQTGLNSADLVYVIQVEGGLSRYLAIFDSANAPARVGPVRSARQTDIPLLDAYGHVGLVYSGVPGASTFATARTPTGQGRESGLLDSRPHRVVTAPCGYANGQTQSRISGRSSPTSRV